MVKPFSPRELMARLKVILARHASAPKPADALALGRLRIDRAGHAVEVDGAPVSLTAKEYALLVYLAENRGIALTREQILRAVWGYDYVGEDRTADWQIKMLRGKLGTCRDYIQTIRGVGYKFEVS